MIQEQKYNGIIKCETIDKNLHATLEIKNNYFVIETKDIHCGKELDYLKATKQIIFITKEESFYLDISHRYYVIFFYGNKFYKSKNKNFNWATFTISEIQFTTKYLTKFFEEVSTTYKEISQYKSKINSSMKFKDKNITIKDIKILKEKETNIYLKIKVNDNSHLNMEDFYELMSDIELLFAILTGFGNIARDITINGKIFYNNIIFSKIDLKETEYSTSLFFSAWNLNLENIFIKFFEIRSKLIDIYDGIFGVFYCSKQTFIEFKIFLLLSMLDSITEKNVNKVQ